MLLILLLLQNLKSEIGRCGVEVVWSNLRPAFADRAPTILQTFWSEWGNPGGEKYFSWNEKTFPKCKLNAVAQLYLLIFSAILLQCPSISFNETDGVYGSNILRWDGWVMPPQTVTTTRAPGPRTNLFTASAISLRPLHLD